MLAPETVAGKPVYGVVRGAAAPDPLYLYPVGEVLFVVGATPADLPASTPMLGLLWLRCPNATHLGRRKLVMPSAESAISTPSTSSRSRAARGDFQDCLRQRLDQARASIEVLALLLDDHQALRRIAFP